MRKINLIVYILLSLGIATAQAQFVDLVNFNGSSSPQGDIPMGDLTLGGNILYGITAGGGIHGSGCVFSVHIDGTGYKDMYDFSSGLGGISPEGQLLLSGRTLYGTAGGGVYDSGFVFSIDTNGSVLRDLFDFTGATGYPVKGSLTLLAGQIYGTAYIGGAYNLGCIFKIDTDGTLYKNILNFNGGNGEYGSNGLTIIGGKIYSMAEDGGAFGYGCIFSVDTNGTGYSDLHDFVTATGTNPIDQLTLSGALFYGTTTVGGADGYGCVFSFDTNGNVYTDIYDFPGGEGGFEPYGSLTASGNRFYGYTQFGGMDGKGNVFSIYNNGTGYTDLFDFNGTNGEFPNCGGYLVLSGSSLYGMAEEGGANSDGVVFSVDTNNVVTSFNTGTSPSGHIDIYPNPTSGKFLLQIKYGQSQSDNVNIQIYNILGEQVYSNSYKPLANSRQLIDLSSQPNGIYLYRVIGERGELIGKGKVIINK